MGWLRENADLVAVAVLALALTAPVPFERVRADDIGTRVTTRLTERTTRAGTRLTRLTERTPARLTRIGARLTDRYKNWTRRCDVLPPVTAR
jgi:hypothetical protein